MKLTTESFTSFSTLARFGLLSVILGTAALTGFAQSSTGSSTSGTQSGTTRAQERASDRSSDRSAMNRDATASGMSRADQKFIEKFTEANQREIALSQLALERATNPQVKAFAQKMVSDHSMAHTEFMSVASGGSMTTDKSSLSAATSERAGSMSGSASASASKSASGATASRDTTSGTQTSGSTVSGSTTRSPDATGHTASSTTERSTASATPDRSRSTASNMSHSGMAMYTDAAKNDRAYKKLMDKNGEEFDKAYMKAIINEHEDAVDMLEDVVKDDDRNAQLRAFANKTLPNMRAHLSEAKQIEKSMD